MAKVVLLVIVTFAYLSLEIQAVSTQDSKTNKPLNQDEDSVVPNNDPKIPCNKKCVKYMSSMIGQLADDPKVLEQKEETPKEDEAAHEEDEPEYEDVTEYEDIPDEDDEEHTTEDDLDYEIPEDETTEETTSEEGVVEDEEPVEDEDEASEPEHDA